MKTLLFALLLVSLSLRSHALTNVWFSPNGTGDGSSRETPRRWELRYVSGVLLGSHPKVDPDVTLHFLPGEYLTGSLNTAATKQSAFRLTMIGHGERPEDVVLKLPPNYPMGAGNGGFSYVSVVDLGRNQEYLRRFVAENMTFDGNWDGQTNYNSPTYLRAYKNSPLWARARTGRIRHVLIRNYGSHGVMPQGPKDSLSGVEAFPLTVVTIDEGQAPEDGDAAPWVVEDCEIAGMHSEYAGYATMIMAQAAITKDTPAAALADPDRRLIWVRRCQARGLPAQSVTVGFGTAGGTLWDGREFKSGRIVFSDNVVLNACAGLNVDTGRTGPIEVTNSVFLDVGTSMYCGTPGKITYQSGFTMSRNSLRLVGHLPMRLYWDLNKDDVLGERFSRDAAGLILNGVLDGLAFSGNWITTRPGNQFDQANRGAGGDVRFRLLNKVPSGVAFPDAGQRAMVRNDSSDVEAVDNAASRKAFDFSRMRTISGGKFKQFGPTSEPALQAMREAGKADEDFEPTGVVERVRLRVLADGRFIGVEEVVLGEPEFVSKTGKLTVRARLAIQPTPGARYKGTIPIKGRSIWLEVLPGSKNPQKLTAETDASGLATFTYNAGREASGVERYRAWADGPEGKAGEWDEFQDVWATASTALGTTVSVAAELDVADARTDRPARLKFTRTGSLDRKLTVNWATSRDPAAARIGRDFTAKNVEGARVTIPAGKTEVTMELSPLHDTPPVSRVTYVTVEPGEGYVPGENPSTSMVVYNPGQPTKVKTAD